ncbi:MAG TPA: YceI family protein [Acidimicrobiales bacterium]|nr:YceI family protein [Acidimicrobiales bacterium]
MLKSRTQRLLAAAVVLVVALGAAGWWFFIRDDAPEAANIDDASKTLDEQAAGSGDSSDTTTADGATGAAALDGTWDVDTSIGSFDDNFTSTYAGYRMEEQLAGVGATTAVGRTPDVTGNITIAGNQVTEGSFEVDMTTLKSDKDMRDNAIRSRGLETDAFPTATFELTQPVDLPADAATSAEPVSFSATGDLTVHGVTKQVTLDFDAHVGDGALVIVGQAPITLADYSIDPPTSAIALSVSDAGTLEFQVFLSQS